VKREQLDHVLREASRVVGERDILVVGSQSILGFIGEDELPEEATTSIKADEVSAIDKARLRGWIEHRLPT